ncbi:unnamed protein product (macronuclear) [Paramecium tetraurelia]|uniref:Uncharacterized protein n=1 Tax=Paramecium tetraurelia TaxID=5888 RepID=A0BMT4_PARTE|nr:uncharacterized protein GSPATT00030487001 [Paramecium tetraurelia]CAK59851.1 unnamed protein product [Paramecium tetraurelia]|eukprot:XP_001427249.1 hypothetical protein (macronuclear) [Paramecium tetraurelia strain d4-2]
MQQTEFETKFNEEIQFRNERYQELKEEKTQQEKQHFNLFRNIENNQFKAVQELETLYEKKILIENEKYLQLEQILIEERQKFQTNMKLLEQDCQKQINEIKKKFQSDLKSLQNAATSSHSGNYKFEAENRWEIEYEKLQDELIESTKQKFKSKIYELQKEIKSKDKQLMIYKSDKFNCKEIDVVQQQLELEILKQKESEKFIQELQNQNKELMEKINLHEQELSHCNDQIKQFQKYIGGLQKSKLVLSYKTYEMQTEMEPKDKKIRELLESIPRLEDEINELSTKLKQYEEKDQKTSNQIKVLNEDIDKLKQNCKKYQDLSKQITMDIYNCYHEKKEKEWVDFIKSMYQKYLSKNDRYDNINPENITEQDKKAEISVKLFTKDITSMIHEFRESDWPQQLKQLYQKHFTGEITNELCRQNQFLVKSTQENDKKFKKLLLWRDQEIYLKTQENTQLLTHLNQVLERKKSLEAKLAKQISQYESLLKTQTRANSLRQYEQKRKSHQYERKNSAILQDDSNWHQLNQSVDLVNGQITNKFPKKGKLIRGQNYNKQNLSRFEQQRQSDLVTQIEILQTKNQCLEQQIKTLRTKLIEAGLDEEITQTNTQRPYSQKVKRM